MRFAGTFWMLWEEEPIGLDTTRFFEFRDGVIFDARTDAPCGTYEELASGVRALFDEREGHQEIVEFRMPGKDDVPFDPEADGYSLTFTTSAYEAYRAERPANDFETDEQAYERKDWETEQFGFLPMHGFAFRDCPEVRELGMQNERLAEAERRRAALNVIG